MQRQPRPRRPPDGELPEAFHVLWPYGPTRTIRQTGEDCPKRAAHVEAIMARRRGMLQDHPPLTDSS